MKSGDLKMVAAYLNQEEVFEDFACFLEREFLIDAATEAGVIVEALEIGADALAMIEKKPGKEIFEKPNVPVPPPPAMLGRESNEIFV